MPCDLNRWDMGHPTGWEQFDSVSGIRVVRLHWSADPEKTREWGVNRKKEVADEAFWEIQYELSETATEDPLVFNTYIDDIHNPAPYRKKPMRVAKTANSAFILGMDVGSASYNHASVLLEITDDRQIKAVGEFIAFQDHIEPRYERSGVVASSFTTYLPALLEWLRSEYGLGPGDVQYFADETARNRQGVTPETNVGIARRHGIRLRLISNNLQGRLSAVDWAFNDRIKEGTDDEAARSIVCGYSCTMLVEALRTNYTWVVKDGVKLRPKKNAWSNVADAYQYGIVAAKRYIEKVSRTWDVHKGWDPRFDRESLFD